MGKNKDLQKMLTEYEKEFGHIKEWEIDRIERARSQSYRAGKLGGKVIAEKRRQNGTLADFASLGGKTPSTWHVESGHWAKCHQLAKEACSIPILQCDKETGNVIREWKNAVEAMKETGIKNTAINNNLKKISKSSGGFIWKYK